MYATQWCPYCIAARRLLDSLGAAYEEIDVGGRSDLRARMEQESGRHTVPQIWIGTQHVGGFDDINALHRKGLLQPLLEQSASDAREQ